MKEHFTFPSAFGQPTATKEIKVTPRFTAETVEGRPKLTGIYHLAVTVDFDEEQTEAVEVNEAVIVIDDLDMNGSTGYFEYAVPFNIDFPPEAQDPVTIKTLKPSHEIKDHQLAIVWDVACTYVEAGIQQRVEKAQADAAQPKSEQVKETSDETTKATKKKAQTVTSTNEKVEEKTNETAQKQEVQQKQETVEAPEVQENQGTQEATIEEEHKPISQPAEVAIGTVASSEEDEVLDFIAELEDGISATSFRLNDIFV